VLHRSVPRQPSDPGLWQPAGAGQGGGPGEGPGGPGGNYYRSYQRESPAAWPSHRQQSQPAFLRQRHTLPADKAFDFNVGDLRGM